MINELFDLIANEDSKMPYLVIGTVIANFNPLQPATVEVKVSDRETGQNISGWARVAMPFAGGGKGNYSLPDIGDEVILAFCYGEIDLPVVIGSLYTLTSPPPLDAVNPLNTVKCVKTKAGNVLKLEDTPGKMGVEISTVAKLGMLMEDTTMSVTLKEATGKTSVKIDGTQGKLNLSGLSGVDIKAGSAQITIDGVGQSITVKAPAITVKGDQMLTLQGTQVNIKGSMVNIQADANMDIKGSAMTNIKGGMIKLN